FLEEYKKRLFILGKTVFVQNGEERYKATAEDIDGDCRLLVRREDGRTEYLSAGEVSLKPFDGKWCADL
ncbi:MAG: biotin--[Clostridia bacterium]|nr:biotin--[acetyl-CoA-carboxylase] ligase [Clostridia bacterium]